jgi:hypothetical protein
MLTLNRAGCIEIVGGDATCAATWDKYVQCVNTACSSCPAGDSAALSACSQTASNAGGTCASYYTAGATCANNDWAKAYPCFDNSFTDEYFNLSEKICGWKTSSTTCSPYLPDPTATVPAYVPASGSKQNKCTTTQINNAYTACFASTATGTTCNTFFNANKDCYNCLATDHGSESYGPIINYANYSNLNQAGCLELNNQASCAASFAAWTECEHQACDYNCETADSATYSTCTDNADKNSCATLYSAANTCWQAVPSAVQTACNPSTFQAGFTSFGQLFCGQ